MSNQAPGASAALNLLRSLLASGCGPEELDANVGLLQQLRAACSEAGPQVDRMFLEEFGRLRAGLDAARAAQEEIRQTIEELTAPPHYPAVFVGRTGDGLEALVRMGGELRAVGFGENEPDEFRPGDEVLLAKERNVILRRTEFMALTCGDTASFARNAGGGRLVIRSRDEENVVLAAAPLRDTPLRGGDLLRVDRTNGVAYEKMDKAHGEEYFLEETPSETFADIGGLDGEIEELKRSIELHFYHPETVRRYRLRRRKSVLLSTLLSARPTGPGGPAQAGGPAPQKGTSTQLAVENYMALG